MSESESSQRAWASTSTQTISKRTKTPEIYDQDRFRDYTKAMARTQQVKADQAANLQAKKKVEERFPELEEKAAVLAK